MLPHKIFKFVLLTAFALLLTGIAGCGGPIVFRATGFSASATATN